MSKNELNPTRLHSLDGDYADIGYWTRGHHSEVDMRAAVSAAYPDDDRHPSAANPRQCTYVTAYWRRVPSVDGSRFVDARAGARGAFPVTALLTLEAEI